MRIILSLVSTGKAVLSKLVFLLLRKRVLNYSSPNVTGTAKRINKILKHTGGQNYLEIGVNYGFTFQGVNAVIKTGVDPNKKIIGLGRNIFHRMSSDSFFCKNKISYDFIFIDGLHEYKQVLKDIINSLNSLKLGGVILIDDVFPANLQQAAKKYSSLTEQEKKLISEGKFSWQGDVYKAIFLVLELFANKFKYATICDDNHYQMMIWDIDKGNLFFLPNSEVITRYEDGEYLTILRNGIPKKWNSTYLDKLI